MRRDRAQRPLRQESRSTVPDHFTIDSLKSSPPRESNSSSRQHKKQSSSSGMLEQLFFVFFAAFVLLYGYYQLVPVFLSAHGDRATGAVNPRLLQKQHLHSRRSQQVDKHPLLPKPGEYAPLRQDTIIPLVELLNAPTSLYHIFVVSSLDDTAAGILTNVVMALFDKPDEHLGIVSWSSIGNQYLTKKEHDFAETNVTLVSKVIEPDVSRLQRFYRPLYQKVFFFVVDRGQDSCMLPQDYYMMCISPKDLLYQQGIDEEKVVIGRIVQRMQQKMPFFAKLNFEMQQLEALRRLDFMYDMTLQMRDLPATTSEVKYGIRGGTAA